MVKTTPIVALLLLDLLEINLFYKVFKKIPELTLELFIIKVQLPTVLLVHDLKILLFPVHLLIDLEFYILIFQQQLLMLKASQQIIQQIAI
jgi:hypothetical protein